MTFGDFCCFLPLKLITKLDCFLTPFAHLKEKSIMDVMKLAGGFSHVLNMTTRAQEDHEKEIPFFVPKLFRDEQNAGQHTNTSPNQSSHSGHSSPSRPGTPLKSFGGLNPELYKSPVEGDLHEYPENHMGRIWFNMEYDKESEKLSVAVVKIRNLPSRDVMNANCCDPFVRVYLLPDERRYSQTKTRRKTCNPKYEDHFAFDVSKDLFDERSLRFIVYDVDSLKRSIPIGTVQYNLREYTVCKQKRLTTWRDLRKDEGETFCQLGELHCSLCYNDTLQRLTVDILEAKNLKPSEENCPDNDTYVKVSLSIGAKLVKSKKTHTVRNNLIDPAYKESFTFTLEPERLDQACICIQVMQNKSDKQIGRVVLGGSMLSKGKSLQHWQEMVHKKKEAVQEWHYLTE